MDTAATALQSHDVIKNDDRIREYNFGELVGQPGPNFFTQAKAQGNGIRDFHPNDGESLNDLNGRITSFLNYLLDTYWTAERTKRIIVFSHGWSLMEMINAIRAMAGKPRLFMDICQRNTTMFVARFTGTTRDSLKPTLLIRNDASHTLNINV
jgi:broad specificity phosphatase PhoE